MAYGLAIRTDVATAGELRRLARKATGRTLQCLLALANAMDGMSRAGPRRRGRLAWSASRCAMR